MSTQPSPVILGRIDRMLARFGQLPWSTLFYLPLGFTVMCVSHRWLGGSRSLLNLSRVLLVALVILRIGPLFFRTLLPFSAELKQFWSHQRVLGRRYDSYQWRKLFWIALGMAAYLILAKQRSSLEWSFVALLVLAGALGHLCWWRRKKTDLFLAVYLKRLSF